jgi:glyoxylase-like metal-dependent hydrolase (beta-lactamase superfamily II)/rhodanese-related sulfurtransferase
VPYTGSSNFAGWRPAPAEETELRALFNRSYVISDGLASVVVDPQRDLDRVEVVLGERGTPVTHVLETHVHNDYLSGGCELARRTGASYGVNAGDEVAFERHPLHDGDRFTAGGLRIRVIATPGHTLTHLAYLVEDGHDDTALFTGGSLLFGSVGRTDLVAADSTVALTRAQYASVHRLGALPASTRLFPTHGFGSFCSSGGDTEATASTIGDELGKNRVFRVGSEQDFVDDLLASFGDYPSYYAHMAPLNLNGPAGIDLATPLTIVGPGDLHARLADGVTMIDIRDRVAYSAAHLPGSISINYGDQLATYVGWLIPFGAPLVLIGDSTGQLQQARRQLARIGFDDVTGTSAPIGELGTPRSFPRRTFDDLARDRRPGDVVLDVRRTEERAQGALPGSLHIPLHELTGRLGAIPAQRVWVHCASGFRAGTAASLLAEAGYDVIQIDDDIDRARTIGLLAP